MPPKKAGKVIKHQSFGKAACLSANDLKRLACNSFDEAAERIHENWDSDPILAVGIALAPDNGSVSNAVTLFQGTLFKDYPKQIKASLLWPFGDGLSLNIKELDCALFEFKSRLSSEFLDCEKMDFSITRKGVELEDEALSTMGFTGFCCRVYLMPIAAQKAKTIMVIYPLPMDELLESNPLAADLRFPGIPVHKEEIELGFDPASLFDKIVGGPTLPAILPGTVLKAGGTVAPVTEIQSRSAALLRQVTSPECKANYTTLGNRWDEIRAKGESQLKSITPEYIWPTLTAVDHPSDSEPEDIEEDELSFSDGGDISIDELSKRANEELLDSDNSENLSKRKAMSKEKKGPKKSGAISVSKEGRKRSIVSTESCEEESDKVLECRVKKRSHKKPKKIVESDSDSDEELGSNKDMASNWCLLTTIWPVSDRPAALQVKKVVNAMDMATLMNLFKMKTERDRVDGVVGLYANLAKDGTIPVTTYKKMKDDGKLELHPARFNRAPVSDLADYYHLVPVKHQPIVRQMNLEHSGSHNAVSEKTVEICHDRTRSMSLKHFFSGNLCVGAKAQKEIVTVEDGGVSKKMDYDWDSPFTLQSLQEAVLNFLVVNNNLYPYDTTGFSMFRILIKYRWISNAESQAVRRNIIMGFFETVSRQNASRANNSKAPLSYDKQLEIMKDILLKNAVSPDFPLASIPKVNLANANSNGEQGRSGGGGSGNRGGGRGGRESGYNNRDDRPGGSYGNRKRALVGGNPVCYTFNNTTGKVCQNAQAPGGCKDDKKTYAHACNVWVNDKKDFCLKRHGRKDHA